MKYFDHIVHGGDYNPDQWLNTPGIIDEDMRLMKLAHINSATVSIFSWAKLEPEEGVFDFEWLDGIMNRLAENGIKAVLATPSGARPAWLAKKYPEVLRVEESGIRNEYGVRHNHCLTSEIYREKVSIINRKLAERYKDHPALGMWHISNEYSGECHCEKCRKAFVEWLKEYYHNSLDELNEAWWSGFWSHTVTDWDQISTPKFRGENHVPAMKLAWRRFVTDSHISFFENEVAPLRELTPYIPVTTNFMCLYDCFDHHKFAQHVDVISWDNYPYWDIKDNIETAASTAFVHDLFRSMKGGKPFFMMESTPSIVNWKPVNKIPLPGTLETTSMQAIAHGSDSVQYFQWRKSRGGHEKFHGAVVDHCGNENTRVFKEVAKLGKNLEKLNELVGKGYSAKVAVVYDWNNLWATQYYCGYNNDNRNYKEECIKWYTPFWKAGIPVDIIPMDADFSKYDIVIAPYLYMLKNKTDESIAEYVKNGGIFVGTYLTGVADENDLCFLGGMPGGKLREVFGIVCEETDSIPENLVSKASFNGKDYKINCICDIIHSEGAEVLGEYKSDFYAGEPSVTVNGYGKGKAYYAAFRNDGDFCTDFCNMLIKEYGIEPDSKIKGDVITRKRGDCLFVFNFTNSAVTAELDRSYTDVLTGNEVSGTVNLKGKEYMILK